MKKLITDTEIAPRSEKEFTLFEEKDFDGISMLNIFCKMKEATYWCEKDYEIGFFQAELSFERKAKAKLVPASKKKTAFFAFLFSPIALSIQYAKAETKAQVVESQTAVILSEDDKYKEEVLLLLKENHKMIMHTIYIINKNKERNYERNYIN